MVESRPRTSASKLSATASDPIASSAVLTGGATGVRTVDTDRPAHDVTAHHTAAALARLFMVAFIAKEYAPGAPPTRHSCRAIVGAYCRMPSSDAITPTSVSASAPG